MGVAGVEHSSKGFSYEQDPYIPMGTGGPPIRGSYTGMDKAGRCDLAYPTVCVPHRPQTWTARTSPRV